MLDNAVKKMLAFHLERLDQVDIGDQDIPITIGELEFPEIIAILGSLYPFVVDLDFFQDSQYRYRQPSFYCPPRSPA